MKLTSAPKLVATMKESPLYRVMGVGLTDNLFLLGHAPVKGEDGDPEEPGGLQLNDPYGVGDIHEAIEMLRGDTDSPLLIALLEAYFSGARDIYLVAVAPMHEYKEPDDRDLEFHQIYRARLDVAYETLINWDIAQFTVPLNAPFNDYDYEVDYFTPLVSYCARAFAKTGEIHLGLMGTEGLINQDTIDLILEDNRLDLDPSAPSGLSGSDLHEWEEGKERWLQAKKFVGVFAGEATFHFKQLPFHHTSSAVTAIAGEMTHMPLSRGMTHRRLSQAIKTRGRDLTPEQINTLAERGINVVGRNIRGRRGASYQVVCYTDNTLALEGSDFWSFTQMRLVSTVASEVRTLGHAAVGTVGYDKFRREVEEYLMELTQRDVIRHYDLEIHHDPADRGRVFVEINLAPYFGVRELQVATEVGPAHL